MSKSAIIFGVGPRQGVGAELCHRAAARGLHVFVNGRTQDKIDAVVADIEAAGGSASAVLADVTDAAAVNAAPIPNAIGTSISSRRLPNP